MSAQFKIRVLNLVSTLKPQERRMIPGQNSLEAYEAMCRLIPVSMATNSYDLLEDLKVEILAEPKRLLQGDWFSKVGERGNQDGYAGQMHPACGTVACAKGWLLLLRRNTIVLPLDADGWVEPWGDTWRFEEDFPTTVYRTMGNLFYTFPEDRFRATELGLEGPLEPGTQEYAQFIADRISEIQKEYESDLKGHAIRPQFDAK